MLDTFKCFLTAHCPICRFRPGVRAELHSGDRLLSRFFIYPFECRSCNQRFRALHFHFH